MKRVDLFIKQFVDEGLGNSSYLIGSSETGRAAVIDPQRDVDRYLQIAEGMGLRLAYCLDTHLHADFVSGARELAARVTEPFCIGASAKAALEFDHLPLNEGDTLSLGDISIGVLSTPGHTPEHISFTVTSAGSAAPHSIFTGGALIVGGAARTDLLGHDFSEPLARQLYHTLHDKLLRFHDEVQVYPTHGGGSFCAAPTSNERTTTIGRERHTNRLAQVFTEDEFVRLSLSGLPSYPGYYRYLREVNRRGPRLLGRVPVLEPLPPRDVEKALANGIAVIDIRPPREFGGGHIPNSYGIPLVSPLNTWGGWVVPFWIADDSGRRSSHPARRGRAAIDPHRLRRSARLPGRRYGGLAGGRLAHGPHAVYRCERIACLDAKRRCAAGRGCAFRCGMANRSFARRDTHRSRADNGKCGHSIAAGSAGGSSLRLRQSRNGGPIVIGTTRLRQSHAARYRLRKLAGCWV